MNALEIAQNVKPAESTREQLHTVIKALAAHREGNLDLERSEEWDLQQFQIIAESFQPRAPARRDTYAQECRDEGVEMDD